MEARGGSFSLIQSMKTAVTAKREEQSLNGSATNFFAGLANVRPATLPMGVTARRLPAHSGPRLKHLEADAGVFRQPGKQRLTHGGDRREYAAG